MKKKIGKRYWKKIVDKTNEAFFVTFLVFCIVAVCTIILMIFTNLSLKTKESARDKNSLGRVEFVHQKDVLGSVSTSVEVSVCGDGIKQQGENCDVGDLGGQSCTTLGFDSGTLTCNLNCTFDTSLCATQAPYCGNGDKETGEDCDGSDVGNATCQLYGFDTGIVACYSNCTINLSGCSYQPNDDETGVEGNSGADQNMDEENDTNNNNLPDNWEVDYDCLVSPYDTAQADPDNDGLTNYEEYQNGCNPCIEDSDDDGMPDGWEVDYGLNPNKHDANEDPDDDGYNNIAEFFNNTHPLISDRNDSLPQTGGDEKEKISISYTHIFFFLIVFSFGFALYTILKNRDKK